MMDILHQIDAFNAGFHADFSADLSMLAEQNAAAQGRLDQGMLGLQESVDSEIDPELKAQLEASLAETAKLMIQIGRELPGNSR